MDEKELNQKQHLAIDLAVKGLTDGEIARRVGVSRQIVNTWRNHDTMFMYELAARRQALHEKHQDKLNCLIEKSIAVLEKALDKGDEKTKLQTAMYVLRLTGTGGRVSKGLLFNRREIEKELTETSLIQIVREMGWVE